MSDSHYITSTSSFPSSSSFATWDDQHRERGRGRSHQRQPYSRSDDGSTTTRRRTHSADSRPQYRIRSCFSMFDFNDDQPVVTPARASYNPRFATPSDLPKLDGIYRDDRRRSLSPVPRFRSIDPMVSIDPYYEAAKVLVSKTPVPYSYVRTPLEHEFHKKDSLIMFGDAFSVNTGISQEELIQKRRDQTTKRRKEKKYKKTRTERILNMPASLLSSTTNYNDRSFNTSFSSGNHKYPHDNLSYGSSAKPPIERGWRSSLVSFGWQEIPPVFPSTQRSCLICSHAVFT